MTNLEAGSSGAWLEPLGLDGRLRVGDATQMTEAPSWVGFLLWTGWWMRRTLQNDTRLVMTLLLPERACCSAFCCLGAILASVNQGVACIGWDDFLNLGSGTRVFLRLPDNKGLSAAKAEILGQARIGDELVGSVQILAPERDAGVKLFIPAGNFDSYEFSLTPHLDTRERRRVRSVADMLHSLSEEYEESWMRSENAECLLVTNRARWQREVRGLLAGATTESGRGSESELEELLLARSPNVRRAKTLLSSPHGGLAKSEHCPIAVLDGPGALKSWEGIRSPNLLVLLSQVEYDESLEDILQMFAAARTDERLPAIRYPAELPPGVEVSLLALKERPVV